MLGWGLNLGIAGTGYEPSQTAAIQTVSGLTQPKRASAGSNADAEIDSYEFVSGRYRFQVRLPEIAQTFILDLPTDVPEADQVLSVSSYSGGVITTAWVDAGAGGGASALPDLSDVTIATPLANQVLKYDGAGWVNANVAYSELTGVPATFTPSSHTHPHTEITDFDAEVQALVDASAKNSIESDGSQFQLVGDAASPGGTKLYGTSGFGVKGWQSFPGLNALSDVTLLAESANQVLQYNSGLGVWQNATLTASDISDFSTAADARIAAASILESQITDGSVLRRFTDTIALASLGISNDASAIGTGTVRAKRMLFPGQISGVSFSLEASDTGTVTVRVVNDAGTNTSVGTASITTDDSAADSSITWSTGSGSFSAGDRIEMETTSGFSAATWAEITAYGTRSS